MYLAQIRAAQPVGSFHLHSAAHATNAGIFGSSASVELFAKNFNDSISICSFSPFNTFYTVQGIYNIIHTPPCQIHIVYT